MTPADEVAFNQFVLSLQILVLACLAVIWLIPNGHCQNDCECKKPKRSHK